MKLLKGKAYQVANHIYIYDGEGFIDWEGKYLNDVPEDIKRAEEYDKLSKYRILLRDLYLRTNGKPTEDPKDKTIVKVYYSDNRSYYGIVKDGIIFTTANSEIRCKYAAFEKAKATREQRRVLLDIYNQNKKLDELREKLDVVREQVFDALKEKENICKKARFLTGALVIEEFAEIFESYLCPDIKKMMNAKGYHVKCGCEIALASNEIIVVRESEIEKWHDSPMVYEEYDNTLHMAWDDEACKLQEEYKKKYSNPLPVDWTLSQELSISDKRILCLTEGYILKIDEMTDYGAKKLARHFNESY